MTKQNILLKPVSHTNISLDSLNNLLPSSEISVAGLLPALADNLTIPIYSSKVEAGFASPADDFVEEYLDLNNLLVKHHEATFFVRVSGHSMIDAGIFPDDILIVDRSIQAKDGKVVIANIEGDVTVKRLSIQGDRIILKAENPKHKDITVTGELHVWGVLAVGKPKPIDLEHFVSYSIFFNSLFLKHIIFQKPFEKTIKQVFGTKIRLFYSLVVTSVIHQM